MTSPSGEENKKARPDSVTQDQGYKNMREKHHVCYTGAKCKNEKRKKKTSRTGSVSPGLVYRPGPSVRWLAWLRAKRGEKCDFLARMVVD